MEISAQTVTWFLFLALIITTMFKGVIKVSDGTSMVVERLGRRHQILMPGLNIIVPFLDSVRKSGFKLETLSDNGQKRDPLVAPNGAISMAEHRMDPPTLKLLCKDNSEVHVNPVAYFKIEDPMRVLYEVASFADSFKSLVETTLRQEVGKLDGDTIVTSREILGDLLRRSLQEAGTSWGIKVIRVEIEDIGFDKEVTDKLSMARREELVRRQELVAARARADQIILEAEATRKALVMRAEGEKEAAVMKALGEKEAQILRAQGDFEQQKLDAEAKYLLAAREQEGVAQGYAAIGIALSNNPHAILTIESLKAQQQIAEAIGKSSNALIIPTETVGLFGAASAIFKGMSDIVKKPDNKPT